MGKTSLQGPPSPPMNPFSPSPEGAIFEPEHFLYQKLNRRKEFRKNLCEGRLQRILLLIDKFQVKIFNNVMMNPKRQKRQWGISRNGEKYPP